MTVLDANILLYAYDVDSLEHAKARGWIEKTFSQAESIGLPWHTIAAFLRISTNRRLPGQRFSMQEALAVVESWLAQPNIQLLTPGDNYWSLFQQLCIQGQVSSALVSDAHLAALTVEYGGILYTTDRDFGRFPGLRWKNPLT